ncbi:MAG: aminoacetone oxidase family FAD-binding enzyme [Chitinophagaceae bacterium BSSC1]|nr:MAG: aminoacetone oxidase family FAD-binding enzyme [Chitinophagaceae bacterium BSSC1]
MSKKLIVIGGGAAGFFCAVNAARMHPGLEVTILEKSNKLLSKVKISGGGRCNTTHACFEIPDLVKKYPRGQQFLKKSFHWFNTKDTIEWFEERGVHLKTEQDGRMFPDTNDSQTIINCLLHEADKYGVKVLLQTEVTSVKAINGFELLTANGKSFQCQWLCIATGGYPKVSMFDWLTTLGHQIETPVPSLFTFNLPKHPITALMGVAVERAQVKINGTKLVEEGPLLITHWGLSGPVVLKLSAWGARQLADAAYQYQITVNWVPDYHENSLREAWHGIRTSLSAQKIVNRNPFGLPSRIWVFLLETAGINPENRWADLASKDQNKLIQLLTGHSFQVNGKTTFKEEFVTCGGIKLSEIDPNTMMSRKIPNLFFAGEVMDIDGVTGGFNFQNAWTSGWLAAKQISAGA